MSLNELLKNSQLWRSAQPNSAATQRSVSSGHSALDWALHSGGWPVAGSTELLCDQAGIGELSLLMPALAQLSQQQTVAWLNPPFLPYTPALHQAGLHTKNCLFIRSLSPLDQLWACEELLHSRACGAVLQWSGQRNLADKDLRRLQLAAREQQCWHIHFRSSDLRQQSSPAPLRLCLNSDSTSLAVTISKQAGGPAGQRLTLPRDTVLFHEQSRVEQWPSRSFTPLSPKRQPLLLAHALPTKPPSSPGLELH